jgi:hypothetical protein
MLQNTHQNIGLGMIEFENLWKKRFFVLVKEKNAIRWNSPFSISGKPIKKWQFWVVLEVMP